MLAVINGLDSRPVFDSGDTKADMVAVLAYHPDENAVVRERILPHFVAYSASNKKFGMAWRNKVMEPPRRELTHLIRQGAAKGELEPGLESDLCLALLLGPILYWHMFLRGAIADPQALAQGVVDAFWRAFGLKTNGRSKR